jgi:hypothetical protein
MKNLGIRDPGNNIPDPQHWCRHFFHFKGSIKIKHFVLKATDRKISSKHTFVHFETLTNHRLKRFTRLIALVITAAVYFYFICKRFLRLIWIWSPED